MIRSAPELLPGQPFSGLVQVAGVHDLAEARMLAQCGVHALGIPLRLPVNTPDMSEGEAAALIAALPQGITPVLITYETDPDALLAFMKFLGVSHVQLHATQGALQDAALLTKLRRIAPHIFIIKSLVIRGHASMSALEDVVQRCAPFADAFITDTFDPATGASGATGKMHDWALSRRLVAISPRPVILAGGLHPGNVGGAIKAVQPAGVDAHTGLEGTDGRKDKKLVQDFVQEAEQAFAAK